MPPDAYTPTESSDTNGPRRSLDSDSRPTMAPPALDITDGSPPGQVEIQQIRLAQHFVMVFCMSVCVARSRTRLTASLLAPTEFYADPRQRRRHEIFECPDDARNLPTHGALAKDRHEPRSFDRLEVVCESILYDCNLCLSSWASQGFAADLFTTLHCPTALVVKTNDKALASQQMTLLEEGASVIEWIAIARPSSKNRALAGGTRRLVATARTRYLNFGTGVKTDNPVLARAGQPEAVKAVSWTELLSSQPVGNGQQQQMPSSSGPWSNDFAQSRPGQHQPDSSHSSNNPFDWSAYPFLANMGNQQNAPPSQQQQQPPAMQTLPVGQVSPIDMTIPLASPNMPMLNANTNQINFGHLPMMPNQMDNWPLSMQNLGGMGMTPGPDPYAPTEGFDVWLSSILSDTNGNNGQGQGGQ